MLLATLAFAAKLVGKGIVDSFVAQASSALVAPARPHRVAASSFSCAKLVTPFPAASLPSGGEGDSAGSQEGGEEEKNPVIGIGDADTFDSMIQTTKDQGTLAVIKAFVPWCRYEVTSLVSRTKMDSGSLCSFVY